MELLLWELAETPGMFSYSQIFELEKEVDAKQSDIGKVKGT